MVKSQQKVSQFVSILRDVKHLVGKYDPLKPKAKKQFVPIRVLKGMRAKNIKRERNERDRARLQHIQYDSSMKFLNNPMPKNQLLEKKAKKRGADDYKYIDVMRQTKEVGSFRDGQLTLTQRDVDRIEGRESGRTGRKKQPKSLRQGWSR